MAKKKPERKYDIIIFGATGFTGTLVAEYFAKNVSYENIKWAIAGRNQLKLESFKKELVQIEVSCADVGVIVADTERAKSMEEMSSQGRVIVTTVGPYSDYGEALVKACVNTKTDYLDITGEPEFVERIYQKYHEDAQKKGVLIINCCGFDSIPADLGTLYTVHQLPAKENKTVQCYVKTSGKPSGGTWRSAIKAMSKGLPPKRSSDKKPSSSSNMKKLKVAFHYSKDIKTWALPFPVIDSQIVKRSSKARLEQYGESFQYGHYLRVSTLSKAAKLVTGVAGAFVAAQFEPTRELLLQRMQSGDGPSDEERSKSFFHLIFIGESESGKKVMAEVKGGDPGYTETSKMLSESALELLQNRDKLKVSSGVTTPAASLGMALVERLHKKGISFSHQSLP